MQDKLVQDRFVRNEPVFRRSRLSGASANQLAESQVHVSANVVDTIGNDSIPVDKDVAPAYTAAAIDNVEESSRADVVVTNVERLGPVDYEPTGKN